MIEIDAKNYLVKDYGTHLLLMKILEDIGLKNVLEKSFPNKWEPIVTLAYYLVCNNSPLMYCDDWADKTVTYLEKCFTVTKNKRII
jgi:hypothetical protein